MKLEKLAMWSEMDLFRERKKDEQGYIGCAFGCFREGVAKLNESGISLMGEARYEYEQLLYFLTTEAGHFLIKSKSAMKSFCRENLQCHIPFSYNRECWGFRVITEKYVWYISCTPWNDNKTFGVFAYQRAMLMTALAKKKSLVESCWGVMPFSGVRVKIRFGDSNPEEFPQYGTVREENQKYVDEKNKPIKITRAQESAMLGGTIYGWDSPAADYNNYDKDGFYCPCEGKERKKHVWSK